MTAAADREAFAKAWRFDPKFNTDDGTIRLKCQDYYFAGLAHARQEAEERVAMLEGEVKTWRDAADYWHKGHVNLSLKQPAPLAAAERAVVEAVMGTQFQDHRWRIHYEQEPKPKRAEEVRLDEAIAALDAATPECDESKPPTPRSAFDAWHDEQYGKKPVWEHDACYGWAPVNDKARCLWWGYSGAYRRFRGEVEQLRTDLNHARAQSEYFLAPAASCASRTGPLWDAWRLAHDYRDGFRRDAKVADEIADLLDKVVAATPKPTDAVREARDLLAKTTPYREVPGDRERIARAMDLLDAALSQREGGGA